MILTVRNILLIAATACAAALTGCTLEPHYTRPQPAVAPDWPQLPPAPDQSATVPYVDSESLKASMIGWREFFKDPYLQKLIELALQHNPDAQIAVLNIAAARAQYRIQRAELFPKISANAVEEVEKFPAAVAPLASGTGTGSIGAPGAASGSGVFRFFDVGVGFTSYELDVFGRIRSLSHSRLQQYLGYVETRRSTHITVIAEVASAYLTLLADRQLLKITLETLNSQQESLKLIRMSFEGGVATGLDLHQAETTVATAQANIAQYRREVAQDRNALVLLLGTSLPDDMPDGTLLDEEHLLADLPAGLPSDTLTRRPDILAAEHNLIAANANIGAARAAFFPSI
ncbi:MAG TPA: efflux transporter outer membrane subunit, partial [Rhizomicrobium sp.]|nr:efflux transporter outer membrane subunit [Rhizomicrobium sp.]